MFDTGIDDTVFGDQNMLDNACDRTSEIKELLGMNRSAFRTALNSNSIANSCVDEGQSSGGLLHAGDIFTLVAGRTKRTGNDVICIQVNRFWILKDLKHFQICICFQEHDTGLDFQIRSSLYFEKNRKLYIERKPCRISCCQTILAVTGFYLMASLTSSYLMLLNCDEVSPSSLKFLKGTIEDCNKIPLGLPLVRRK